MKLEDPRVAEDIQMLVNYWIDPFQLQRNYSYEEAEQMTKAAERVEAYLSTFKPDHL